jgi:hypothetical protein
LKNRRNFQAEQGSIKPANDLEMLEFVINLFNIGLSEEEITQMTRNLPPTVQIVSPKSKLI